MNNNNNIMQTMINLINQGLVKRDAKNKVKKKKKKILEMLKQNKIR